MAIFGAVGFGKLPDSRCPPGGRLAGGHLCSPRKSSSGDYRAPFRESAFSADDLVKQGALPEDVRTEAERMLRSRRNILVSGGTGSGKTTLLNALIELLPEDERIVAIEDTLELRIERSNCVRFEARGLQEGAVTIRDLVRHALRIARITSWWERYAAGRPPICCRPSTPTTAGR